MSEKVQAVEKVAVVETPDTPEVDPAIEAEARKQGWNPDKERHPDGEWMDAETFVKKSREINTILKQNNNRLQRDLDAAKADLNELKLTTKGFAEEFAKMKDNAYKKAISELKSAKRDATKEDNLELVDDLEDRIDSLKAEQAKIAVKPVETKPAPDMTVFNEWRTDNKWYDSDKEPDLFDAAEAAALKLSLENKSLTGLRFLDKVTEIVKSKFPDRFENPRRKSSPHEGGGSRGESSGSHTYNSLPADAKKACDRYVKQGIMTKEAYVAAYEWNE
jgi:hypothetical protein